MTAVLIKGLKKTFQNGAEIALNGINAQIPEGKVTGIIGPDGSGKTTLLRILSGLMTIDSGECLIFSKSMAIEMVEIQKDLSYLPQKFCLYEDLTVAQNLSLYSELQGVSKNDPNYIRLLKFSGLGNFQNRLVGDLSGGMKQKLGLMTALLRKPKLLLLDEPTIGVDPISQNELWEMFSELNQLGMTIVISTSYLIEAERCDEVLLLNEGEVLFSGEPRLFKKIVEGKTFFFENVGGVKRGVLDQLLGLNGIIDAIVEGDKIRVIFNVDTPNQDPKTYGLSNEAILTTRTPDFEDAFIYKLGGIPKRPALKSPEIPSNAVDDSHVIEAIDLTKYFGDFKAVNNISFSIRRGEIFGLLGPNGAGKSTTFKMLCGLLLPTNGEALVGRVSMRDSASVARGMIGYMAQKFSLYDNMTVIQNLNFFSGIYSVKNKASSIEEMVKVFNLNNYIDTLVVDLPLGFKQRLALSCALMHQPKVLFLDEPTSGVDPLTRREFWHQINALAASGVSILVSTHLMDEAEFCDRIGMIHKGALSVVDTPDGLKRRVPKEFSKEPTLIDVFTYFGER